MILPDPPVLVITDRHQSTSSLAEVASRAFAGGCRWLLVREKDLAPSARAELLAALVTLGRGHGASVLASSDVAAARETGATGVHLARDGDVAAARQALGAGALIGYSAHDLGEAAGAAAAGADYVTLSPVFESPSKPDYGPVLGLAGLTEVAKRLSIPVLALGGVTVASAAACMAAGAAGVAVMGPVMRAADPAAAVRALVAATRGAAGVKEMKARLD